MIFQNKKNKIKRGLVTKCWNDKLRKILERKQKWKYIKAKKTTKKFFLLLSRKKSASGCEACYFRKQYQKKKKMEQVICPLRPTARLWWKANITFNKNVEEIDDEKEIFEVKKKKNWLILNTFYFFHYALVIKYLFQCPKISTESAWRHFLSLNHTTYWTRGRKYTLSLSQIRELQEEYWRPISAHAWSLRMHKQRTNG